VVQEAAAIAVADDRIHEEGAPLGAAEMTITRDEAKSIG
jgi:hypothetical protein